MLRLRDACAYPLNVLPATPSPPRSVLRHTTRTFVFVNMVVANSPARRLGPARPFVADPRSRLGGFRLGTVREAFLLRENRQVVATGRNTLLCQVCKVAPQRKADLRAGWNNDLLGSVTCGTLPVPNGARQMQDLPGPCGTESQWLGRRDDRCGLVLYWTARLAEAKPLGTPSISTGTIAV